VKRGNFLQRESDEEPAVADGRHRVRVLIGRERFRELQSLMLDLATHRTVERLRWQFWNLPFEPYAPVRKQLLRLLRQMNAKRKAMGYERIPVEVLRLRRRIVKPFEAVGTDDHQRLDCRRGTEEGDALGISSGSLIPPAGLTEGCAACSQPSGSAL
jgi:hypothetical protein